MNDTDAKFTLLDEMDALQNQVLDELDALSARIEQTIAAHSATLQPVNLCGPDGPTCQSPATDAAPIAH